MSPRRTRRGAVKESIDVSVQSLDNSIKAGLKAVRSTRRTNKIMSPKEEGSPLRREILVNHRVDSVKKSTKKQKKKDLDTSVNQSSIINKSKTTKNVSTSAKKSRSTRQNKSYKPSAANVTSTTSEDEILLPKNEKSRKRINQSNDIFSEEEIPDTKTRKKMKSLNESGSGKKDKKISIKTPEKSSSPVKSIIGVVTPKNAGSPLNISFSPDRSRKTPRVSPLNLGSPKSHLRNSKRALKVSRKLSIEKSPPSSEESNNSYSQSTSPVIDNKTTRKKNHSKTKNKLESSDIQSSVELKPSRSPKIDSKKSKLNKTSNKSISKKSIVIKKRSLKKESPLKLNQSRNNVSESILLAKTIDSSKPSSPLKNSPRFSPSNIKKSPKIVIQKISQKSPSKTNKSTVRSSLSKSKESPVKSSKIISPLKSFQSSLETKKSLNSPNKSKKSLDESSKSNKSLNKSSSRNSLSQSKKSSKVITPLSSKKMPKIVLNLKKSPLKSKKSPISSRKSTPHKSTKSEESLTKSKHSLLNSGKSALSSKLVKTPEKSSKLTKSKKISKVSPSKKGKKQSLSPRVMIQKLSSPEISSSLGENTSLKKSPKSPRKSSEIKLVLKNLTPSDIIDKKFFHIKPKNTSTPREKVKRQSPVKKFKAVKRLNNESDIKFLEDESEPSINESSLIHLSNVYDSEDSEAENNKKSRSTRSNTSDKNSPIKNSDTSKNKNKRSTFEIQKNDTSVIKNNTYEVESPKTPGLLKKTKQLTQASENKSKKNVKVQFTSPAKSKLQRSSVNRAGTPGHAIQKRGTSSSTSKLKTPTNQLLRNKIENKKRILCEQVILNKTPTNKRLSVSLIDSNSKPRRSLHESQIASVNRLSKPKTVILSGKKSAIKTPSAKKIPNFSEIHKKSFAKMESLVDLKQRVEKRHTTLNSATSSARKTNPMSGQNLVPPNSKNQAYSRFGFKLRKNDAVDIISKKSNNIKPSDKKREAARSTLKGVRMNRRFELIMKSRNKA